MEPDRPHYKAIRQGHFNTLVALEPQVNSVCPSLKSQNSAHGPPLSHRLLLMAPSHIDCSSWSYLTQTAAYGLLSHRLLLMAPVTQTAAHGLLLSHRDLSKCPQFFFVCLYFCANASRHQLFIWIVQRVEEDLGHFIRKTELQPLILNYNNKLNKIIGTLSCPRPIPLTPSPS